MTDDLTGLSRFLSYVLRHDPDAVGVSLDRAGWTDVDTLLAAMAEHDRPIDRSTLDRIVAGTDKRRFEVRAGRIRAAQGHSIAVELDLDPLPPPPVLYHGTVERFLPSIRADGLHRGQRRHVHLSADRHTATAVGARRGPPVILTIDAAGMHQHGHAFYQAANGVWLTAYVPPQWISGPAA